ncbi:hypothetical protein BDY21DRAFT_362068 [Lineolata rhizophorae]|uniref:Ubiquitin carboxyl-terminal hydrolase n=1 Tax=Lineolata rhizophorae TaxID=578093 RepID=A0A6A6P5M0_9PEZI|nr:hypothetical protein BDY21DRAFT_362068 [Lineolata rhizophorae]
MENGSVTAAKASSAAAGGGTLASPKLMKANKAGTLQLAPSTYPQPAYGCEHVQHLLEKQRKLSIQQYKLLVETVQERSAVIKQTYRPQEGSEVGGSAASIVSLTPTFLCLQCPAIHNFAGRNAHYEAKGHAFSVESRQGCLFCQECRDYVYDPVFEDVRLHRGRYSKRPPGPSAEPPPTADDLRLVALNTVPPPCRAIGLRGLYNMGQTCFMSVIVQALLHNPFMRAFFLGEGHRRDECARANANSASSGVVASEEKSQDKAGGGSGGGGHAQGSSTCTSCALDEIFQEFHSSEKTEGYGAVAMLMASWMSAQSLAGYQQQDAHEYMQFLFNALHQDNRPSAALPDGLPSPTKEENGTKRVNNGDDSSSASYDTSSTDPCPCIIHNIFYGQLQSTVTCAKCRNVNATLEPVVDFSLELQSTAATKKRKLSEMDNGNNNNSDSTAPVIDLRDCLERFTRREKLPAAEYSCGSCGSRGAQGVNGDGGGGKIGATKQLSLKQLGPVCVMHLKRFEHAKSTASKIDTKVKFPLLLDMYPYTTRAKQSGLPNSASPVKGGTKNDANSKHWEPHPSLFYELSAVIVHKGKIDSGHYVAYTRDGPDWFLFDDSKVVLVSEKEVLEANAYLLMYVVRSLE